MPEFAYEALAAPQERAGGRIFAESEDAAAQSLLARGLQPIEIRLIDSNRSPIERILPNAPIGHRSRAIICRQLSDLVASGMSVLDALELLTRQTKSSRERRVLGVLQDTVREGRSLGDAMATTPKNFGRVHVSLVKAGERAGLLAMVLTQVATLEEKEAELRARVQGALLYPGITAFVGLATILVILNYVIPRLSLIFEEMGEALPFITRVLLALSIAAQWAWKQSPWILLVLLVGLRFIPHIRGWGILRDRFLLHAPRLGRLIWTLHVARFSRVLGSLLANGVPMVQALEVTTDTLDNQVIQRSLTSATARIRGGDGLGAALEKDQVLPRVITSMIAVGEKTGNLEGTLTRISDSATADADRSIKLLVALLEPALILVMGVFVAFIVAAVIIPIFQVNLAI